jgi:hypothetical protein
VPKHGIEDKKQVEVQIPDIHHQNTNNSNIWNWQNGAPTQMKGHAADRIQ